MKNIKKGLFSVLMLLSVSSVLADSTGKSFFLSNAGNVSRLPQMGAHRDSDKMYGHAGVQFEYMGSTKSADLGKYFFFGGTNNNVMKVGPQETNAPANATTDIFSVNLLLGELHDSNITIKPTVDTFTTNLSAFIGLDEFWEGLHLTVDAPIVHTKSNMHLTETSVTADTTIATGFLEVGAGVTAPHTTAIAAFRGQGLIGDVTSVMAYGKIDGSQSQSGLGNTTVALGYDFMNKENCHLGLAVVGMFNGSKNADDQATFWGETGIGTYGRHGVGGRLNGHIRAYEADNCELNLHLNAEVLSVFKGTQRRTYDWTNHGVGSRYMLVKENSAQAVYADVMHYGTNISTLKAKISIPVMYDVSLVGRLTHGNMCFDLGYQLNGHDKEKHHGWVTNVDATKFYAMWAATTADTDVVNPETFAGSNNSITGLEGTAPVAQVPATTLLSAGLNKDSALAPAAMSHRIHGGLSYNWADSEWEPALGVNGGYQIAGSNEALSGWVVGLNGSVCF